MKIPEQPFGMSPVLPKKVFVRFPGASPGCDAGQDNQWYTREVNLGDVLPDVEEEGHEGEYVVHDSCQAIFNVGTAPTTTTSPGGGSPGDSGGDTPPDPNDPSNKAALDGIANQIATNYYKWRMLSFDLVYPGIIAPYQLDASIYSFRISYSNDNFSTRLTSYPWNGEPEDFFHTDSSVTAPECPFYIKLTGIAAPDGGYPWKEYVLTPPIKITNPGKNYTKINATLEDNAVSPQTPWSDWKMETSVKDKKLASVFFKGDPGKQGTGCPKIKLDGDGSGAEAVISNSALKCDSSQWMSGGRSGGYDKAAYCANGLMVLGNTSGPFLAIRSPTNGKIIFWAPGDIWGFLPEKQTIGGSSGKTLGSGTVQLCSRSSTTCTPVGASVDVYNAGGPVVAPTGGQVLKLGVMADGSLSLDVFKC